MDFGCFGVEVGGEEDILADGSVVCENTFVRG